jgi:hypothetical protein
MQQIGVEPAKPTYSTPGGKQAFSSLLKAVGHCPREVCTAKKSGVESTEEIVNNPSRAISQFVDSGPVNESESQQVETGSGSNDQFDLVVTGVTNPIKPQVNVVPKSGVKGLKKRNRAGNPLTTHKKRPLLSSTLQMRDST